MPSPRELERAGAEERLQDRGDLSRAVHHLVVGEALGSISVDRQPRVPATVALTLRVAVMRGATVGLHHQPGIAPREVGLVRAQLLVHLGLRKASLAHDQQKPLLECVASSRGPGLVVLEQRPDSSASGATAVALERYVEPGEIEQSQELCLVQHSLQAADRHDFRDIDQGPGHGRDRHATVPGEVAGSEVAWPVNADAGAAAPTAARHRDVNRDGSTSRRRHTAAPERC